MIPKVIHYCWFGRGEKSKLIKKCIKSWKKICPDYTITEWNEDNFDLSATPDFVKQAYAAKKWAFVSDYARLKIVYENGGIYLDTDVELIRPLTDLLEYAAYFGAETDEIINTGLGFGAHKGAPILHAILQQYEGLSFDPETCVACPYTDTPVFLNMGWRQDGTLQILPGNVAVFPAKYFNPKERMTGGVNRTLNTYSIHHYASTWHTKEMKTLLSKQVRRFRRHMAVDYVKHIPNRMLRAVMGEKNYEKFKNTLKKKSGNG